MSEYNQERKRDQSDLETSNRFNQPSDENEEDDESNKKRPTTNSKTRAPQQKTTTSILKNTSINRSAKVKTSPRLSRLQSFQQNNDKDDEDDDDDDYDDQNENETEEENDEKLPLSHQQQTNYNNRTQKVVKIMTRQDSKLASSNMGTSLRSNQQQSTNQAHHFTSALKNSPTSKNVGNSYDMKEMSPGKNDLWGHLLIGMSYLFLIFTFPFSLCACVKVAQEYERAVIFRLGRILPGGAKGPGIFFVLPCIDTYTKVDLRTVTFDVPPQEILTKDSVTVSVDAVVYFRIFNAVISVINVEDAAKSTKLLAASTLRNILGTKSLHEILSDRESVAILIQNNLDDATGPWGVKVERVEVKDVRLPVQLQRAMATEAEAAREARAKVIAAEGEQKASKALKDAALVISESPIAIQLRYLQTLTQIASEKNSTIVFPIPLEMLSFLANKTAGVFKMKVDKQ